MKFLHWNFKTIDWTFKIGYWKVNRTCYIKLFGRILNIYCWKSNKRLKIIFTCWIWDICCWKGNKKLEITLTCFIFFFFLIQPIVKDPNHLIDFKILLKIQQENLIFFKRLKFQRIFFFFFFFTVCPNIGCNLNFHLQEETVLQLSACPLT